MTGQGEARRCFGSSATPNFLSVLGASVASGRSFQPGEESPGRDRVVISSHSLWMEYFGGDRSALGRVVRLDGMDRGIVGIMPPGFSYPSAKVELWIPMRMDPSKFVEFWGTEFMPLVGRLRPGVALGAAQAEARNLANQFRGMYPYPMPRDFNADSTAIPLQRDIVGDVRGRLLILLSSVAVVLLIACANVASLLLSRATTRRSEMALRAALGAGRSRTIRQLLTEGVGLGAAGAGIGILMGFFALNVFKSVLPASLPGLAQAEIDWQVVAVAGALALLTGLASAYAPALCAAQIEVAEAIRTGSPRSASNFWTRIRGAIICFQVALTVVLLVSAGLLLTSVYRLSVANPGFEAKPVLTVQISPDQPACARREACIALYQRLLLRAGSVNGVREAASPTRYLSMGACRRFR